jgi:tetratricopeptide (TPR) repeat protein
MNEDVFVNNLKEAVQLSILEERSQVGVVRYRFTHAFFRQTLYEEMIAPQRLKLHQQVARALEDQYEKRLGEHAAELAEHFSQSTDPTDLGKAIAYGEMAAKRATDVYAYGEAVRLLDQALKVQKVLDPDDKAKQCDLLLELADALSLGGESRHALDVELQEAFSLAQSIDDHARASRACMQAMGCLVYYGVGSLFTWGTPEAALWVERADRYARPETIERAWADQGIGGVKCVIGNYTLQDSLTKEGVRILSGARELARRLNDPETFWIISAAWAGNIRPPQRSAERLLLAEELAMQPRAGVTMRTQGLALMLIGNILLEAGQRQRAEGFLNEMREIAERSGQVHILLLSMVMDGIMAAFDGRLEEAVALGRRAHDLGDELGLSLFGIIVDLLTSRIPKLYLGKIDEIVHLLADFYTESEKHLYLNFLAHAGQLEEVTEILEKSIIKCQGIASADSEFHAYLYIFWLEAAVIVGHRRATELLLSRLENCNLRTCGLYYPTCPARHLGAAAAFLERYDEARKYYQEAIKVCTEMRFRPEIALTRLQLAELLLEHYPKEKKEALEHLDFAIKEFREMKMQPSLERALRHKDILKA